MCGYAYHRIDKAVLVPDYPERGEDEKMLAEIAGNADLQPQD